MADDFKIKIVTEGDSRGADRVADSLGKVTRAAGDNAKAAAQTSRGMNDLGEASEKGAAVGRVFGQVMAGNVGALAQLGAALKATGAALKTNIVGVALIGATALVSFLQQVRGGTKDMGDAAGDAAPKVDAFADALKKAGDAKNEALAKALADIKDQAKGAADELERVLRYQERIAKAKGEDTPEAQRAREDIALGAKFTSAQQKRDSTAVAAATAADEAAQIERQLQDYNTQRERRRALELELQNLRKQPRRIGGQREQVIKGQLAATAFIKSPEQAAAEAALRKRLDPARAAAASAAKTAAEAEGEFRGIARDVVGIRPDGSAIRGPETMIPRGLEDRAARQAAGALEPQDRGYGSRSEVVESGATSISVKGRNGEDIGKRIADAVEARVREGEEAIARAVERRMQQVEQQLKSQRTK
jgi:hypothetical protein